MDVRIGLRRKLSAKELMLLNCGVGEDCKEIQPVHSEGDQPWISLEGMMLKLKLQYFGHLMWRVDSSEKTLMLGGIGGRRKRGRQRMRWLDGHESEWTPGVGDGQGGLACCDSWGCKESDMTELLNWTELNWTEWKELKPFGEAMILGLGQGRYKMSLEHLVVSERKKVLKKWKNENNVKWIQELLMAKPEEYNQSNK